MFLRTVGHTNVITHEIDTGNSMPVKQRVPRLPFAHRAEAERQIKEMLKQDAKRRAAILRRLSQS